MNHSVSRRVAGVVGAATVVVLALAGLGYLRAASNAERIDDRNFRELARTAGSIEGAVNNLQDVLESLAGESKIDSLRNKARLIPDLEIDGLRLDNTTWCPSQPGRAAAGGIAKGYLDLCYNGVDDSIGDTIRALYWMEGLRPSLASDYMNAIFLADASGSVLLWASDQSGVRVRELPVLDSLHRRSDDDVAVVGTNTIVRASIAGQDYYFYLLPLRIDLARSDIVDERQAPVTWVLGGVISVSEHRMESLSLNPPVALFLGFIAVMGFLAVPIVLVYTMGPRERLRVGNLLYLVFALVLAAGLVGLGLADFSHFWQLRGDVYAELDSTAVSVAENIDAELEYALELLDGYSRDLRMRFEQAIRTRDRRAGADGGDPGSDPDSARLALLFDSLTVLDSIRMRSGIDPGTINTEHATIYPELHMVFWADSAGYQVAKWTTRENNTPRVNVEHREYHRAIRDRHGWPLPVRTSSGSACSQDTGAAVDVQRARRTYYVESIRSVTTGEKLAAISTRFPRRAVAGSGAHPWGVGVVVTELASLRHAVLPAGVKIAVVDTAARTLFHTRPELELAENFAEETDRADLLRSVLHARACRAFNITYGGRRTRLVIRPLGGRPLFLLTFMDRSLLDTVLLEAWFLGAALFGAIALLLFIVGALLDRIAHTRLGWVWPDVNRPGKYAALVVIAVPLLTVLTIQSLWPTAAPAAPASFLIPVLFLGLGLVALSNADRDHRGSREVFFGWGLVVIVGMSFLVLALVWQHMPWLESIGAVLALLLTLAWRYSAEIRERVDDRTRGHAMPRHLYAAAMTMGLVVVSVLPGYLAYQVAFLDRSARFIEHRQLEVDDALKARAARLESIIRERVPAVPLETVSRQLIRRPFDQAFAGIVAVEVDTIAETDFDSTTTPGPVRRGDWPHTLSRMLGDNVPFFTDGSVFLRQLSVPRLGRVSTGTDDQLRLRVSEDSTLVSALPPAAGRRGWLLGLLGAVAAIGLIVYRVSRRILFIHLEHAEPLTLDHALPRPGDDWQSTIFVGTRSVSRASIRERGDVQVIDLMSPRTVSAEATKPVLRVDDERRIVCLDHFDYRITEPEWNRHLLVFLEQHIYAENPKPFVIITSRDPDALLLTSERSASAPRREENGNGADASSVHAERGLSPDEKRRWDRVLGQFTKVIVTDRVPSREFERYVASELPEDPRMRRNAERVRSTLIQECGRSERLQDVGRQILTRHDWAELEYDEIVNLIRDGAETYYGARWAILTDEERLVAAQLASGAVVNPQSRQAVTRLFARGFVTCGPEPRLDTASFTRFVRDKVPADRLTTLERADSPSTWKLVRGPLIVGSIGVALFLFWTQRDLLGSTIAFLSTVGVGLGAIFRILTMVERGVRKDSMPSS